MTPLSRPTLAAANSCHSISSSPSQSATLGETGRSSSQHANLWFEPKKSFIYNKISLGAEPNEPNEAKPFRRIPNEPINPLKTNKSDGFVPSLPNPDRRALPHQPPDFVHLLVRHRDAPLRPVALHPYPIWQAVDHDVPAGIHPRLPRARYVRRIRVRNMQRQMVFALCVPPVDGVPPLRRPPVAFLPLRPHRLPPQRDPVRPQHALPAQQHHFALLLAHNHQIRPQNPASHPLSLQPSIPPSIPAAP